MKKRFLSFAGVGAAAIAVSVALLGCQSAPPKATPQTTTQQTTPTVTTPQTSAQQQTPGAVVERVIHLATPGTVSVVSETTGFAPSGTVKTELLSVAYGKSDAIVKTWKIEILDPNGADQRVFTGDKTDMQDTVSWDGMTDANAMAPEGSYTAKLTVDFENAKPVSSTSDSFILDITPPSGTIALSSRLYSPDEGSPTITLTVDASSKIAAITNWTMQIFDPGQMVFKSFSANWPDNQVVWDGKSTSGDFVQSAEDYPVVANVSDEYGNVGKLRTVIPVDILVQKTDKGYFILASRIFFKPFTADYVDVPPDVAAQNAKRLDDLSAKLKKFPDYRIRLVGHAVMIYWWNNGLGALEQKYILLPLSQARSEAIRNALVQRNLDPTMFTTIGVGASDQLVPDSDLTQRWQNRRVAFFLEKG